MSPHGSYCNFQSDLGYTLTMRSQRLTSETATYISSINACGKGELANQALQLFKTMRLQQLGEAVAGAHA